MGANGTPFALDYGAVMLVGQARATDLELLAEILPDIECVILAAGTADPPDNEED